MAKAPCWGRRFAAFGFQIGSGPGLPRRLALAPDFVQILVLAVGVHGEEESVVLVRDQLALAREPLHGTSLKGDGVVVLNVVEHLAVAHEVSGTDPSIELRLFEEAFHAVVAGDFENAETRRGTDGGNGHQFAVRPVELDDLVDVHVAQSVAVGQQEGFVADILGDALDAAAGHGLFAGVGEGDLEVALAVRSVVTDLVPGSQNNGAVAVHRLVVEEVLLDVVAAITQAKHELVVAEVGVALHNMPQHGLAADLNHGLGAVLGLLAHACSLAAAQNDNFHQLAVLLDSEMRCTKQCLVNRIEPVSLPSFRLVKEFFSEVLALDQKAEDVLESEMRLLDVHGDARGDDDVDVGERLHDSSVIAQVAHRMDAHGGRGFERLDAVFGVAAGRDGQQYVSLDAQGLDLPFEDILVAVVVSYGSQDAAIRGEGGGPEGGTVEHQARNELGDQVLRIRGRASIAADHQLAAGLQGIRGDAGGFHDGGVDSLIVEHPGNGRDRLAKLLLDHIFENGR